MPVLDLGGYTCLPGLIDMHTHLADGDGDDTADLSVYYHRTLADQLPYGRKHARTTLDAGFTTVRDVGTYIAWTDRALRDEINSGQTAGPRMQVAGYYLTIPGGGGDLVIPGHAESEIPDYSPARRCAWRRRFPPQGAGRGRWRRGPAQGHRLGRRARVRRRPGRTRDDTRRDQGGRRGRARRRSQGGRARARRTVDQGRDPRRRRHDRARVADRRRGHRTRARAQGRAVDGYLQRRLHRHRRAQAGLARGVPAQEPRDDRGAAAGVHEGARGGRADRVRHRRGGVPARPECPPVRRSWCSAE